jgi:hypothetical protein
MANKSMELLADAWLAFFSQPSADLPQDNLEAISQIALRRIQIVNPSSAPEPLRSFYTRASCQELVIAAARLRTHGLFPPILASQPGEILASRLVLNWNVLLIREENQLVLVYQGVTSCDAVLIPGLNSLLIVCHIDFQRVAACVATLSRTPDFFRPSFKPRFGGYLVGHSRPYHCFYDGLPALECIRQEGQLSSRDLIFSKCDEAFVDVSSCLALEQEHQRLDRDGLNQYCSAHNVYLLQLGFWFNTRAQDQVLRQLVASVDEPMRQAAIQHSIINETGAIEALKHYQPLLWIGITGQKRCWIEQVNGTAELLNTLHQFYPKLGIIFDGWTPPLTNSNYHRKEISADNKIIHKIIRRLNFKTRKNTFIVAGLPFADKIRIGLEADGFLANYTSGSLVIARICGKPGVGHMGRRMMASKHQHIHYRTSEPDPMVVRDVGEASTPTGYVNYSIPWQALYNELIDVLAQIPITPEQKPCRLIIPQHVDA